MIRQLKASILILTTLSLIGCNQSDLARAFDGIAIGVATGTVLISGIGPSAGIPQATVDQVVKYLSDVADALPKVQAELNSGDSAGVQAVKINDILLPYYIEIPGAPPQLANIVHAVSVAVRVFLDRLQATAAAVPKAQKAKAKLKAK